MPRHSTKILTKQDQKNHHSRSTYNNSSIEPRDERITLSLEASEEKRRCIRSRALPYLRLRVPSARSPHLSREPRSLVSGQQVIE
ncbi:unnamed protein product, partial [Musa acuminata subsp. burmannicoides]